MNTKQLVQSSVNVIRITSINPGDMYKRFDDSSSYSNDTFYGIVKGVHNNGEKTVIETTEFKRSYSSLDISNKIFTDKSENFVVFPATLEEFNLEIKGVTERKENEIERKKEEIKKLEQEIIDIKKIESGEMLKGLKEMSYKEITQTQYEAKKLEISSL